MMEQFDVKLENYEKRTTSPVASILHVNLFDLYKTDNQIFICSFGSVQVLIKPIKTVLAQNQRLS